MASAVDSKKLRILLIPFFATSHIGPFTDLAIRLTTASPDTVEATVAVTPANLLVVQSFLERPRHAAGTSSVKTATYPFPTVEGLSPGVENLSMATPATAWRIDAASYNEALTRPLQEAVIRERSPDALVTDMHFFWNVDIADELGVPCVMFHVAGAFPALAMRHLVGGNVNSDDTGVVTVPRFPPPDIRIPMTELPEYMRRMLNREYSPNATDKFYSAQGRCFGLVVNTFLGLEQQYCELHARNGYAKRAYFVGPVALSLPAAGDSQERIIDWLDAKPSRSVVYVCFGSLAPVSDVQLDELAHGLEAAGQPFLWVVRDAEHWSPPEGWAVRVGERGMVLRAWAPQTAILGHPAVGAFVTHCGWNSVLETVAAGVPVLTWPIVFEQFITERLVTEVLGIGQRLWPGPGRSTRFEENKTVPAEAVAKAVAKFMCPGGQGDVARSRVKGLATKAHAALAQSGSSVRDLHRLIDHLMEARAATADARTTLAPAPEG